ncbi:MAG: trypsin-like peptidase domain-containing protein [Lachnospiraceae bacterium]|nr:trypsin-like peptidase domain-containing protein [Lachnospiraceae bacterium]
MDNNFNNGENQNDSFIDNQVPVEEYTPIEPTPIEKVSYVTDQKEPKKKKGGFLKFVKIMATAVCFGFVAGCVMFGVTVVGDKLVDEKETDRHIGITLQDDTEETTTKNEVLTTETTTSKNEDNNVSKVIDVSDVVDEVMPSIVAITSTQIVDPGYSFWFGQEEAYEQEGAGSGIIVGKSDKELLIVTNNHVVADADSLSVQFINETSVDAYIKGTNADNDLAVVSIPLSSIDNDTINSIKIATLGDSNNLEVGEGAIAIGNALGYGQSVTTGVISAVNRDVNVDSSTTLSLVQTDAAINPGNSGGALLNTKGEVIGINAAKYSSDAVEGMGFAIPISNAREIINELMNKETKIKVDEEDRGYIGINGRDVDDTTSEIYGIPKGVYVYSTVEGGAAKKAGIEKGSVIVKFDGESISSMSELKSLLEYYAIGEEVVVVAKVPDGPSSYVEKEYTLKLTGELE